LTVFLLAGLGILNIWLIFPQHFEAVLQFWQGFGGKLLFWSGLSASGFHWLAGVRHLFMSHDVWQIQTNRQRNALSAKILIMLFIFWLLFISAEIWL
jgi:succinate dehydrogenase/fumarate reductase cytochrome b subunit